LQIDVAVERDRVDERAERAEVETRQAERGDVESELVLEKLAQVQLEAELELEIARVELRRERERRAVERREDVRHLGQDSERDEPGEARRHLRQRIEERALELGEGESRHAGEIDTLQQALAEIDVREIRARELDTLEI